jgi:hypothetical protein
MIGRNTTRGDQMTSILFSGGADVDTKVVLRLPLAMRICCICFSNEILRSGGVQENAFPAQY